MDRKRKQAALDARPVPYLIKAIMTSIDCTILAIDTSIAAKIFSIM
jgi:hypothetical protein